MVTVNHKQVSGGSMLPPPSDLSIDVVDPGRFVFQSMSAQLITITSENHIPVVTL
jgi:hypothetical protein